MLFLKLLLNGLLYIILIAMANPIDKIEENKWLNKLSNNITPFHYNSKITLMSDYINGESDITFNINRAMPYIILRMPLLMNINEVNLKSIESGMIYAINYLTHIIYENDYSEKKLLIIEFLNQSMPQKYFKCGVYILYSKFSCKIIDYEKDFMRTLYIKEEKDNGFIFATLILPRRAQQLFPCWDEPTLRATFNISVEHDKKYKVLSNMLVQEYKFVDDSMMYTVFQTTPLMSTYDVAIIMSDLYRVSTSISTETTVNVWCKSQVKSHMKLMQYVAENVIAYLENNFKILRRIPKVDYVAIPNLRDRIRQTWGLVFYNEADIIYNEELDSVSHKTTIMRSVTRDIIYQWFGNLFSPFCRSHRLLNEGFITFLETHVIDKAYSDSRNISDLLVVQTQHEALYLNSYFAINSFAKNMSNISEFYSHFPFSHIIGTAIWRMLNGILINDSLMMGLNAYFNIRFAYLTSSTPDDLWNFIQVGIYHKLKNILHNTSIKQIMDIWTKQTYCPVVNVIRNYSNDLVKISKDIYDKFDQEPYFIPITYIKETNIDFINISPQSSNCLTQSNPEVKIYYDNGKDKWFIVNILQTGYYRVNYDTKNWQMIARYLNSEEYRNIHVINRAQIIDDAFHLAIEKKLDFSIFWKLAKYLSRERNYVAWYPMIKIFERISSVFAFSTIHDEYLKTIKITIGSLFEDIDEHMYNQTTLTNNDLDKYLKQDLTKWGCLINNSLCVKMANQQFEWHLKDPKTNKFLSGWKKLISCTSLKTVSFQKWICAWANALNVCEKKFNYEMLKYLSCSHDPQIIFTYLQYNLPIFKMIIIEDKNINFETLREKEHVYALTADIFLSTLAMHAKNPIMLKYILENFEIIKNRLIISDNKSGISTIAILIVIINNVYSKNELDMINKFAKNMTQFISDVERKITMRLLEIESQLKFYDTVFSRLHSIPKSSTTMRPTTAPPTTTPSTTTPPTTIHSTNIISLREHLNKIKEELLKKYKYSGRDMSTCCFG